MDLNTRVAKLVGRATPLSGVVYRSATPEYANSSDLLSGEGSRTNGGRWNPIGVAAVYGSFTPQTALEEALAHASYYGLPVHAAMPRTFIAIEFALVMVLDLTEERKLQALGISDKQLVECDWRAEVRQGRRPITQEVGEAAKNAGFEAIRVPSAADGAGQNLVVFIDNLRPDSGLSILAANRL